MIKPVDNKILVRQIVEKKLDNGLELIPEEKGWSKGVVVDCGNGLPGAPMEVKPGDVIWYSANGGIELDVEGEKLRLIDGGSFSRGEYYPGHLFVYKNQEAPNYSPTMLLKMLCHHAHIKADFQMGDNYSCVNLSDNGRVFWKFKSDKTESFDSVAFDVIFGLFHKGVKVMSAPKEPPHNE
jgi:co-chaperonin GroES (HSP10)